VVKIEPPDGEPSRHVGPFLDDLPHPERVCRWYTAHQTRRTSIWKPRTVASFWAFGGDIRRHS
jgi:hypothetical protein